MTNFDICFKNKKKTAPLLYGLFFEDINHSLDGGLNANLVQNGNFEFCYFSYSKPDGECVFDGLRFWSCEPRKLISITDEKPIHVNNPHSLKVEIPEGEGVVLKNFGYEIQNNQNFVYIPDSKLNCSFFYASDSQFEMECFLEYENEVRSKNQVLTLPASQDYKKVEFSFVGKKGSLARLVFKIKGKVCAYFTNFSLIPSNYFVSKKNKYPYGKLNRTLVESIDMGAKFLRFPGGCLVEGDVSTDYLYEWEKTIGPIENRISKPSVWNYLQSNEIGFFEYFCLCEDLGLSPLPVHHVGLGCQIRSEVFRHMGYNAFTPSSKEFKEKVIDSIAHLIYFAKGDISSIDMEERIWAGKRKEMGHSKPFKLDMIGIGNENWDKVYFRNFNACMAALKNYLYKGEKVDLLKHFNIGVITSAGVDINPQDTNPSWRYIIQNYHDLVVDEHVYNTTEWFVDNFYRYDFYDKNESKVFMGEYACHTDADGKGLLGGKNNFKSALSEAVFMCGMENNPEIVKMSCYAPLFVKKYQQNWLPDLIEFSQDKVVFTPNYFVQKLFMQNYGKFEVKPECEKKTSNRGKITFVKGENKLEKFEIFSLQDKELKIDFDEEGQSKKDYENVVIKLSFQENPKDFTLGLGVNKREGFRYYLHFDSEKKALFYEKIVNNFRMTLELLCEVKLGKQIEILFTNSEIKILQKAGGKLEEIAKKHIWKNHEKIFSSLTFDEKNVYLKLVNISKKEEEVCLNFDEKLLCEEISGQVLSLVEDVKNLSGCKLIEKNAKFDRENFKVKLKANSVNIFILNR